MFCSEDLGIWELAMDSTLEIRGALPLETDTNIQKGIERHHSDDEKKDGILHLSDAGLHIESAHAQCYSVDVLGKTDSVVRCCFLQVAAGGASYYWHDYRCTVCLRNQPGF